MTTNELSIRDRPVDQCIRATVAEGSTGCFISFPLTSKMEYIWKLRTFSGIPLYLATLVQVRAILVCRTFIEFSYALGCK